MMNGLEIEFPNRPNNFSQDEWEARVNLAACYRLVDYYGWSSTVYNHITLRVPNTDTFLINGFGLRYDEICASNLVLIDLDGNKLSDDDLPVNKAGFLIHSAIHQARPEDLHCVMHSHEANCQTLAASKSEFIPLTQEGCQMHGRVGYHDFNGIVLRNDEQEKIIEALGDNNHTLLMRNHGLLTAGPSAAWAFIRHQHFRGKFSEECWGNPPGGYNCSVVPSLRENKPSNMLLKATGPKNKPAASTSTLKLG